MAKMLGCHFQGQEKDQVPPWASHLLREKAASMLRGMLQEGHHDEELWEAFG